MRSVPKYRGESCFNQDKNIIFRNQQNQCSTLQYENRYLDLNQIKETDENRIKQNLFFIFYFIHDSFIIE